MARQAMTIGRLAAAAGVNVETIRYYQRRGLLDEPEKPFRGCRRYPPGAARRVRFIKRAQALGFTLEEIAGLLRLDGEGCCSDTRALAEQKLAAIEQKLRGLTAMRDALADLVGRCGDEPPARRCPIISALAQDG